MDRARAESSFDLLLAVATGIGVATHVLGVPPNPLPAFVLVGVIALVPRGARAPAGAIGPAVGLAGIVLPAPSRP